MINFVSHFRTIPPSILFYHLFKKYESIAHVYKNSVLRSGASPQMSTRPQNSAEDSPANSRHSANENDMTSPRMSRQLATSPPLVQIREEDEESRAPSVKQSVKEQLSPQPVHSPAIGSGGGHREEPLRAPQPQERRAQSRSPHPPVSPDNRPTVDERLIDLTQAAPAVPTPASHTTRHSANAPQGRPTSTAAASHLPAQKAGTSSSRPQSSTIKTAAIRRPPGPGPRTHYVGSTDQTDDRTARLLQSPALSNTSTLPEEVSPTPSRSERIAAGRGEQEFNRPRLADSPTTRRLRRDVATVGPEFFSRSSSSEDLDAHRSATDTEFDPSAMASDPFGPPVPVVRDPRERFVPLGARPPAPVFVSPRVPPPMPAAVEGYIDLSGGVPISIPHRFGPPVDDRQPRRMLPQLQPGLPMQRPPLQQQQLDWAETHSLRSANGGRMLPPQPPYAHPPDRHPIAPNQPPPIRSVGSAAVREFAAGAPLPPHNRRAAHPPSGAYVRPLPEQQSELSSSEGDWF